MAEALTVAEAAGPALDGLDLRVDRLGAGVGDGMREEGARLRKQFWGRHFWARGYLAVSSGTITDDMIQQYIDEQQGEQIADDSRFPIDTP